MRLIYYELLDSNQTLTVQKKKKNKIMLTTLSKNCHIKKKHHHSIEKVLCFCFRKKETLFFSSYSALFDYHFLALKYMNKKLKKYLKMFFLCIKTQKFFEAYIKKLVEYWGKVIWRKLLLRLNITIMGFFVINWIFWKNITFFPTLSLFN